MTLVAPLPAAVPQVGKFRPTRLPPVEERTLGNGLRVLAVRTKGIPMVQARLALPAPRPRATSADRARQLVLAETLLSGTERRDSVEVAEALQRMGGHLGSSVDSEDVRLRGSALSPSLGDLLALLGEVWPSPPSRRARSRSNGPARPRRCCCSGPSRPSSPVSAFKQRIFGDHSYAGGLPDPGEVAAVTAADLRRYFKARVTARGGLLVLVGDLRPGKALDAAEAAFGSWTGAATVPGVPPLPPVMSGPIVLVDRPGAAQSNIRIGGPALTRQDDGLPALLMANMIFGGYFSSRLVENIRENKGYTYSPRSWLDHFLLGSILNVSADVGTEVTAPALLEIRYELGRMATLPVTAEELDSARRYLIGTTALSTQTQSGLADYLFTLSMSGLDLDLPAPAPEAVGEGDRRRGRRRRGPVPGSRPAPDRHRR